MNDSVSSFSSVRLMLRPAQNTKPQQQRPPRLTGVITVIAVALPSTLATARALRFLGSRRRRPPQCA